MRKHSFIFLVLLIFVIMSALSIGVTADAAWAVFEPFEGVREEMMSGNLIPEWSFDSDRCLSHWNPNGQSMDHISTASGGYLRCYDIPNPTIAFQYTPTTRIPAGTYKFTGYFRTSYEGEVTELRFHVYDKNHPRNTNGAALYYIYPTHDEWLKVEFYVTLDSDFDGLLVCGGPYTEYIQSYCIDNFSLVSAEIPADYTAPAYFGTPVNRFQAQASNNGSEDTYRPLNPEKEEEYEVQGIVMNRDIDFIGSCIERGNAITAQDFIDYVYQYEDTHVTDFMFNIFCQMAMYPSAVATDFLEQYDYYTANNMTAKITTNQNMANLIFREKGIDFIEIFCEKFREIGIDFWLSYRMNDSHNIQTPSSVTCWDFFTSNPQYRRIGSRYIGSYPLNYYNNSLDYTHEGVRKQILQVINESLSMYDCAGVELDFQRDIYIWYPGGEYNGLDILTEFMREVNRIAAIYEEKYGHEIKVALRCASDIQTNYDLGLDVITFAAEGLVDLVNPTSRWATTDFQIPVSMWAAVMHPYGVEVAPGIESLIQAYPGGVRGSYHTLNTVSGAAANWFSQGADKFYFYNLFLGLNHTFPKENRISTVQNNLMIGSGAGHFNMLTTVGSYEKLMNRDREIYLTYNDIYAPWKTTNEILSFTLSAGVTAAFRISTGHIPSGAEAFLIMSSDESVIADKCLQITDRTNFWVGAGITTPLTLDTTKTYQVKLDIKCDDPNAGLRPLNDGIGTWYVGSTPVAGAVRIGSGSPIEESDGWYTYTFNFVPSSNARFKLRLCGGVEAGLGAVDSTADIFIDNIVILEDGVPVLTYDFNHNSQFSGWAYDRGAHPDATGTIKAYSRIDQCLQITDRTNFWVGAGTNTNYTLDTTKTYQLKIDVKCADLNAGLRPINDGVTWYVGSNAVAGAVTIGSGSPIEGSDGWYTHTFSFVPSSNSVFKLRLCGGVESSLGAVASTADIFIDNIVILEDGVPVLTYDFSDDSQIAAWAYDRGAHPDATGTVKAYLRIAPEDFPPTVYVNGHLAEFVSAEYQATGMTTGKIMTFRIPECVYDDEQFIVEFTDTKRIFVDYAKIYIKRPIE